MLNVANLAGQQIGNGRYIVRSLLGKGGMGSVWLCSATHMDNRDVAIKFPDAEVFLRPGFRERFRDEIRALLRLGDLHAGIVKIIDVGEFQDMPFAVMQYLSGGSLDDRKHSFRTALAQTKGRQKAVRWLEDASRTLDFMHAKSLIHRDIKPPNILFDQAGNAYVADFGIAKVISEASQNDIAVTRDNQAVGTLMYMPYEMLCGQPIDGRADQYALAATLYESLVGRRPYEATNPIAMAKLHEKGQPPLLHELNPALPPSLSYVLLKALACNPERRFRTCTEFAEAVIETLRESGEEAYRAQQLNQFAPPPAPPTPGYGMPTIDTSPGGPSSTFNVTARPHPQRFPPAHSPTMIQPVVERPAPPSDFGPRPTQPAWQPPPPRSGANTDRPSAAPMEGHVPKGRPSTAPVGGAPVGKAPVGGAPAAGPANPVTAAPAPAPVTWRNKTVICPWCWKEFRAQDILWVAEHPDLLGDAKLGSEAAQRFLPDQFSANCRAIDLRGTECYRTACPGCHQVVPQESVDFKPIFISLLGAPTSGKTCFLTAMSWQLRQVLPTAFRFAFTDADPELNQSLIDNERLMFMNQADDLVRLAKTEVFGGDRYVNVTMGGQSVSYLKPYIFSLRPTSGHPNYKVSRQISFAVNLYDNSGESFLPGQDRNDSPVTRHLSRSDAVIFVFDPSQHPGFRKACAQDAVDPQFISGFYDRTIRQETILTEALKRIRQHGSATSLHEKRTQPLIVVLNKFDAWAGSMAMRRLDPPWGPVTNMPDHVKTRDVKQVSDDMRKLLDVYCRELVAAADEFSSDVTFLPVSSFGRRVEAEASGAMGVRAGQIQPMWAEMPLLWILANVLKGVIPRSRSV